MPWSNATIERRVLKQTMAENNQLPSKSSSASARDYSNNINPDVNGHDDGNPSQNASGDFVQREESTGGGVSNRHGGFGQTRSRDVSARTRSPGDKRNPSVPGGRPRHTVDSSSLPGFVTGNPNGFTRDVTSVKEVSSTDITKRHGTFGSTGTQPFTTEEELKLTNNFIRITSRSTERGRHVSSHPSLTSWDPYKGNQSTLVLATVPVILIPVLVLLSIWYFWKRMKCRFRNRRNQGHTKDAADVTLKELDPPTTYFAGTEKETKIKSGGVDQNLNHDHLTQRREVEERSPKFPSRSDATFERKRYENISNTSLHHTVTSEAISNDSVTSHRQYDLYDKLERGGQISTVNTGVKDAKSSEYDGLDAISSLHESVKYDILSRDGNRASAETPLPDVTEDAEYSRVNRTPSTSSSSSHNRLTRNVKIKGERTD